MAAHLQGLCPSGSGCQTELGTIRAPAQQLRWCVAAIAVLMHGLHSAALRLACSGANMPGEPPFLPAVSWPGLYFPARVSLLPAALHAGAWAWPERSEAQTSRWWGLFLDWLQLRHALRVADTVCRCCCSATGTMFGPCLPVMPGLWWATPALSYPWRRGTAASTLLRLPLECPCGLTSGPSPQVWWLHALCEEPAVERCQLRALPMPTYL